MEPSARGGAEGGAHLPETSVPHVKVGLCKMEQMPSRMAKAKNILHDDKIVTSYLPEKRLTKRPAQARAARMVTHVTELSKQVFSAREHLGGGCQEVRSSPHRWDFLPTPPSLPTPLPASTELKPGPEALPFAHRFSAFLRPFRPVRVCLSRCRVLITHVLSE